MTTWTNEDKLSTQDSITYGEAGITYGEINIQYNGKTRPAWTNQAEN